MILTFSLCHEFSFLLFELGLRAFPGAPSGCTTVPIPTLVEKYCNKVFLLGNSLLKGKPMLVQR